MNLLDPLVVGYTAYRVWRGKKLGFTNEFPRLVSIALALLAGGGLYHWMMKGLASVNQLTLKIGGPIGFVGVTVGAFWLAWKFRRRLRDWAAGRVPEEERQRRLGMIAGGARGFCLCALLLILGGALPIGEFRKPFRRNSYIGYLVHRVIAPVHQAAQNGR